MLNLLDLSSAHGLFLNGVALAASIFGFMHAWKSYGRISYCVALVAIVFVAGGILIPIGSIGYLGSVEARRLRARRSPVGCDRDLRG